MKKAPRYFIWDNILAMSAYWACSGAIISGLSAYFGFSLAVSNLVAGFTAVLPIVQLAGGLAYGRVHCPLRFLRLSGGLWRVFLPCVFFSVLLPQPWGAAAMILSYMLAVGIYQFSASPQISWMSSCVKGQVPQNYYAHREMLFMAAYTAIFCLFSLAIDRTKHNSSPQSGFVFIGMILAVLMAASVAVLLRIPAPPSASVKQTGLADLKEPFRSPAFRRVILANMVWNMSCNFVFGFSAVYQVQVLGLSFVVIMLWTTVSNLFRTAFTPIMARLAKRIGWKNVTAFSAALMAGASLIWAASTRENAGILYPAAIIISTIPHAGLVVGFLNMQIGSSPEENRSVYVSVVALMNGVAALVGSLLCSWLVHELEAISPAAPRYIFYVGTAVTLAAAAAIYRVADYDEPDSAETEETI